MALFVVCSCCCCCLTCCCVESSWRERTFAIDVAAHQCHYFRTDEAFQQHKATGAASMAGTIQLDNAVLYVADYMDFPFCIELAARDAKNITTRHFFLFANSGAELREWMLLMVEAGATAAGPTAPLRVVPEGKRQARSDAARHYNSMDDGGAGDALEPLPFPVTLAKFGFLQKRGVLNTGYKTRFCRIERNPAGLASLVYYSTVEITPRNGEIALQNITIEDDPAGDELSFRISVAGTSRSYCLRAPSKAQKRRWCSILQRVAAGETVATEDPKSPAPAVSPTGVVVAVPAAAAAAAAPSQPAPSSSSSSAAAAAPKAAPSASPAAVASPPGLAASGSSGGGAAAGGAAAVAVTGKDGKMYKRRIIKKKGAKGEEGADDREVSVTHSEETLPLQTAVAAAPAPAASPVSPPSFAESPMPAASPSPPANSNGNGHARSPSSSARDNAVPAAAGLRVDAGAGAAASPSSAHSGSLSGQPSQSDIVLSLLRAATGSLMYKLPTGAFASVEKKKFYLLDVATNPKASRLLAEARVEMKGKDKAKVAYYDAIASGYLLHWDSSKAFTYESFVWLDPRAPRTAWSLHWGQTHMSSEKSVSEVSAGDIRYPTAVRIDSNRFTREQRSHPVSPLERMTACPTSEEDVQCIACAFMCALDHGGKCGSMGSIRCSCGRLVGWCRMDESDAA